jgi:transposase-like protein
MNIDLVVVFIGETVKKRRFYSDDLKISIYMELLSKTDPPVLHHGVSREVALKFGVPQRLVQVWRNGQDHGIHGVKNKLTRNCGRKRVEIDMEAIKSVPLSERTTFQDLANALGVKKTTLYSRYKEGRFRRHTNDLKFSLTDENKKPRVRYCLSMLLCLLGAHTFKPMYNIVYTDEKWFYRTRRNQKYYLANDEERPQRAVKSKNFIKKVMFLTVVTRPRFDADGNCTFDGKLGIFCWKYALEPTEFDPLVGSDGFDPLWCKSPNGPQML